MRVELIGFTPSAAEVIAKSYGTCTNKHVPVTRIQKWIGMGHESPIEHAIATFSIEGISRSCLAQLTRHRLASFSVESMRYCDIGEKKTPWSKFTDVQEREIYAFYESGKSTGQIAISYDCSQETVANVIRRQGETIRGRGNYKAGDLSLFSLKSIDEGQSALLGLIFADGCLYNDSGNYRIIIKMQEKHIVRQCQKILCTESFRSTGDNLWQTVLSSKTVFERVRALYGCHPAKSKTMVADKLKKNLPQPLVRHFIRGYFEGDGCVNVYQEKTGAKKYYLAFTSGSKLFLSWVEQAIRENCSTKKKKIYKMSKSSFGGVAYKLQFQGRKEIERLLNWMYAGIDLRLFHSGKINNAAKICPDIRDIISDSAKKECDRLGVIIPKSVMAQEAGTILKYVTVMQQSLFTYDDLALLVPNEDRRMVLPLATATRMVMTANLREWRHVFAVRISPHAQWEIRQVCQLCLTELLEVVPSVFEDMRMLLEV